MHHQDVGEQKNKLRAALRMSILGVEWKNEAKDWND